MTAFEELKKNVPCDFWASEYSSNLCARFRDVLNARQTAQTENRG